jgi:uncharacterized protein (DUF433 family)
MLGQGVYTLAEAARLARLKAPTLRAWFSRKNAKGETVFASDFDRDDGDEHVVSFLDLIDIRVVGELRQSVSMHVVRRFFEDSRQRFGDDHPFAHERFFIEGNELFVGFGRGKKATIASTRTGQTVFVTIVKPFLQEVTYNPLTRHAQLWKIAPGIVVDPTINLGAPTLRGTRLKTSTIASAVRAEGGAAAAVDAVAQWFDLDARAVRAAIKLESRLAAAA